MTKETRPPSFVYSEKGVVAAILHMGRALKYSAEGLYAGCKLSLSFRQEVAVFVLLCAVLTWFDKPVGDWLLCLGVWSLVMVVELINTALEEALNLITLDYCIQVKNAKDMASAAVFLMLVGNAVLWVYIFWNDLATLWPGA